MIRTTLGVFAYSAGVWGGALALAGLPPRLAVPAALPMGLGATAAVVVVQAGRES